MKSFFKYVLATILGIFGFFMIMGLFLFIFIGISSLFSGGKEDLPNEGILELSFNTPILENSAEKEVGFFNDQEYSNVYYRQILKIIEQAKNDDHIKGISLDLYGVNGGTTQADDIRNALEDFKSSGKFVYAYGVVLTQKGYYLASVADSIFLNPMGGVELTGLVAENQFYKNLGEKYGIDFQVIRHGKYKSAVEPFTRTDYSEENKQQLSELLNSVWGNLSDKMSSSRNISAEEFQIDTDSLFGMVAPIALEHKLIDVIFQKSEYNDFLREKMGFDEEHDLNLVTLSEYLQHLDKEESSKRIAIIYASGMITDGESDTGISSEPYMKMIRDLADDDLIKSVVLRVNSGGGSAVASDQILFELKKLSDKKPLVVSFGDVAASGGYYIAMAGERIYADPNTITGSIGVFGMLPSFEKLANNIGITTDQVSTNANSLVYSPLTALSSGSRHAITLGIENTYNRFLQVVSENRKMPTSQVDNLGQGRVWTGQDALKNGLIDELGTLENAIAHAAELAELEDYKVDPYPKPKDEFELFLKQMRSFSSSDAAIKESLGEENYELFKKIQTMQEQQGIMMYFPYEYQF